MAPGNNFDRLSEGLERSGNLCPLLLVDFRLMDWLPPVNLGSKNRRCNVGHICPRSSGETPMNKPLLLTAILIVPLIACELANAAEDDFWSVYSRDGRFSVEMPGLPELSAAGKFHS